MTLFGWDVCLGGNEVDRDRQPCSMPLGGSGAPYSLNGWMNIYIVPCTFSRREIFWVSRLIYIFCGNHFCEWWIVLYSRCHVVNGLQLFGAPVHLWQVATCHDWTSRSNYDRPFAMPASNKDSPRSWTPFASDRFRRILATLALIVSEHL